MGRGDSEDDGDVDHAEVVVGIDFGSSFSAVAVCGQDGVVEVIPNDIGARTTPSCVFMHPDGRHRWETGETAHRHHITDPASTVRNVKQVLGCDFDAGWRRNEALGSVKLRADYPRDACVFATSNGSAVVTAEEVAADVLRTLKASAEAHLERSVRKAVLAVPSYFTLAQRFAVQQAATLAGLTVELCDETSAAALAYASAKDDMKGSRTVVVVDVGGGGGSAAVARVSVVGEQLDVRVLASSGTRLPGGRDLDSLVLAHLQDEIKRVHQKDVSKHPKANEVLKLAWESAKQKLSRLPSTAIKAFLPDVNVDLSLEVTRDVWEAVCEDHFRQLPMEVGKVVRASGVKLSQVDDVLLVGGTTRSPRLRSSLEELFGRPPCKAVNPDEAVARGAALLAAGRALLRDVTACAVLLELRPTARSHFLPMASKHLEPNMALPCDFNLTFPGVTSSGCEVKVHQGPDAAGMQLVAVVRPEQPLSSVRISSSGLMHLVDSRGLEVPVVPITALESGRLQTLLEKEAQNAVVQREEAERVELKNRVEEQLRQLASARVQDEDDAEVVDTAVAVGTSGLSWLEENPSVPMARLESLLGDAEKARCDLDAARERPRGGAEDRGDQRAAAAKRVQGARSNKRDDQADGAPAPLSNPVQGEEDREKMARAWELYTEAADELDRLEKLDELQGPAGRDAHAECKRKRKELKKLCISLEESGRQLDQRDPPGLQEGGAGKGGVRAGAEEKKIKKKVQPVAQDRPSGAAVLPAQDSQTSNPALAPSLAPHITRGMWTQSEPHPLSHYRSAPFIRAEVRKQAPGLGTPSSGAAATVPPSEPAKRPGYTEGFWAQKLKNAAKGLGAGTEAGMGQQKAGQPDSRAPGVQTCSDRPAASGTAAPQASSQDHTAYPGVDPTHPWTPRYPPAFYNPSMATGATAGWGRSYWDRHEGEWGAHHFGPRLRTASHWDESYDRLWPMSPYPGGASPCFPAGPKWFGGPGFADRSDAAMHLPSRQHPLQGFHAGSSPCLSRTRPGATCVARGQPQPAPMAPVQRGVGGTTGGAGDAAGAGTPSTAQKESLAKKPVPEGALLDLNRHFARAVQLGDEAADALWPLSGESPSQHDEALLQQQAEEACVSALKSAASSGCMVLMAQTVSGGGREMMSLSVRFVEGCRPREQLLVLRDALTVSARALLSRFEELCDTAGLKCQMILFGLSADGSTAAVELERLLTNKYPRVLPVWNSSHRLDEAIARACHSDPQADGFFGVVDAVRDLFLVEKMWNVLRRHCASVKNERLRTYEQVVHLLYTDLVGVLSALERVKQLDRTSAFVVSHLSAALKTPAFRRMNEVFYTVLSAVKGTSELLTFTKDASVAVAVNCIEQLEHSDAFWAELVRKGGLIESWSAADKRALESVRRCVAAAVTSSVSRCGAALHDLSVLNRLPEEARQMARFVGPQATRDLKTELEKLGSNRTCPSQLLEVIEGYYGPDQFVWLRRRLRELLSMPLLPCERPIAPQVEKALGVGALSRSRLAEPFLVVLSAQRWLK